MCSEICIEEKERKPEKQAILSAYLFIRTELAVLGLRFYYYFKLSLNTVAIVIVIYCSLQASLQNSFFPSRKNSFRSTNFFHMSDVQAINL